MSRQINSPRLRDEVFVEIIEQQIYRDRERKREIYRMTDRQ
jgi:hypothetical protein